MLPVELTKDGFVITGKRGRVVVTIPEDTSIELSALAAPMVFDGKKNNRIAIKKVGKSGSLTIFILLETL